MEFPHAPNFQHHQTEYLKSIIQEKERRPTPSTQIITVDIALLPSFFGNTDEEKLLTCIEYLKQGLYIIDSKNDKRTI